MEFVRIKYRAAEEGGIAVNVRRQMVMPSKRLARWCGLASDLSQDGHEAIFFGMVDYRIYVCMYICLDVLLIIGREVDG